MELNKKSAKLLFLVVAGAIALFWGLNNIDLVWGFVKHLFSLASPILIGFCIAFVLNVPLRFLERHFFPNAKAKWVSKIRRPLCILLSLALIILVLTLVINLVIPELIGAFSVLANAIPKFFADVQKWAIAQVDSNPALESWIMSLNIPWNKAAETIFNFIKNGATGFVGGTISVLSGIFSGVVNLCIAFIFAAYMLISKEKLSGQLHRVCKAFASEKLSSRLFDVAHLAGETFAHFIAGQCTEAAILGSLCWLGMLVLHFPYAPMIGALVGISALIPIVGAFVGLIVGAFMIMMVDPMQAIWFIIFLLILQQIEGNLIYPRVVGTSVGLPAIWVLAAVTVGGGLFGIVGMLFAVPMMSIIYALTRRSVNKRLVEKDKLL
ncbi:MAG: AI-2E family transporter [Oscillospiraceae bacterium]